jgi:CheY-like chemotaxis protein
MRLHPPCLGIGPPGTGSAALVLVCKRVHVLLVEDDPITVFTTRRALRQSSDVSAITVAFDGRDALDRLLSGAMDSVSVVVLTDLDMPRMSGLELVAAIRREASLRALPILVLTASTDEADRRTAMSLDVAGYFVKVSAGVHLQETLAWVRQHCADGSPPS